MIDYKKCFQLFIIFLLSGWKKQKQQKWERAHCVEKKGKNLFFIDD